MADIGSTLREARMRARIDISEVEVGTKIRAKYLRALENEEWDLLPGPVYVKSFLRTYGDFLGLDSRLLVDEFKRRYERPSDQEFRGMAPSPRERDRRSRGPSRLGNALLSPRSVIVAALIVIVLAIIVIGSHNGGKSPTGGGNTITPAGTTTGPHHHPGTGTTGGGTTTTGTTSSKTTTTPIVPKRATLTLVPTSTVWICVENQTGTPLMTAADYSPGQTIPTLRSREMLVTLGNTSVTMTANGKPYALSGGTVQSLKVTSHGVTTSAIVAKCQ
jgi:cytoskeleton protein RodZ